ncbi:hypothetical protein ATANTOWER_025520 [Ataeniobius toweri]|uniref:Secreted protein n=1 Tax=Ataeniobius toweri TaxID=208326 RepID=A0ABU7BA88_9TELE|nr:hypothetical protein [Ataeniobius toweri]
MSQNTSKTWCLRLLPVLVFVSLVTYYRSYAAHWSYGGPSKPLNRSKSLCGGWLTQKKWESLNFKYCAALLVVFQNQNQLYCQVRTYKQGI